MDDPKINKLVGSDPVIQIHQFNLKKEELETLIASRAGRRFIWNLLSSTGVFFNAYSSDTNQAMYQLGMQQIGQTLFADLILFGGSNAYEQMRKEAVEDKNILDSLIKERSEHYA